MNVKILVIYHKPSEIIKNRIFAPILVGAGKSEFKTQFEGSAYFDDCGENISDKNPRYNELTAIYWAWKNYEKLGSPDYIGFCHYRRFFIFEERKSPYYEATKAEADFFDAIAYSEENVKRILDSNYYIAPIPSSRQSVKSNYARAHRIEDLELALEIIREKYPDYASSAEKYLDGSKAYFHNMFVFDKETFFTYCDWLFDILAEFEKRAEVLPDRFFISERLTGIFLTKLEQSHKKGCFLPTLYLTSAKQTFKEAIAQTKSNFRSRQSGILYAMKPIIVYFTPKWILRARRRKNAK